MVRASVSFNKETKTYDWKVTNNECPTVFEITTPNHNLCIIRNYPYEQIKSNENFRMFCYVKLEKDVGNLFQQYPLSRAFWLAITDFDEVRIYHPIQNKFVDNVNNQTDMLAGALHIDILLHVLEFDRQRRRDELFEHQFLKTQFETDMKSIVQLVPQPQQVVPQPTKPTHDCTLATKGYCRGWQDGFIMHSCPDLSWLAR